MTSARREAEPRQPRQPGTPARLATAAAALAVAGSITGATLWGAHAAGGALTQTVGPERLPDTLTANAETVAGLPAAFDRQVRLAEHDLGLYLSGVLPGNWGEHSPEGAFVCGCAACCGTLEEPAPGEAGVPGADAGESFAPVETSPVAYEEQQEPAEASPEKVALGEDSREGPREA